MIGCLLWIWVTYTLELNQENAFLQKQIEAHDQTSYDDRKNSIENAEILSLKIEINDLKDENKSLTKKVFDQKQQIANLLTPYK